MEIFSIAYGIDLGSGSRWSCNSVFIVIFLRKVYFFSCGDFEVFKFYRVERIREIYVIFSDFLG